MKIKTQIPSAMAFRCKGTHTHSILLNGGRGFVIEKWNCFSLMYTQKITKKIQPDSKIGDGGGNVGKSSKGPQLNSTRAPFQILPFFHLKKRP